MGAYWEHSSVDWTKLKWCIDFALMPYSVLSHCSCAIPERSKLTKVTGEQTCCLDIWSNMVISLMCYGVCNICLAYSIFTTLWHLLRIHWIGVDSQVNGVCREITVTFIQYIGGWNVHHNTCQPRQGLCGGRKGQTGDCQLHWFTTTYSCRDLCSILILPRLLTQNFRVFVNWIINKLTFSLPQQLFFLGLFFIISWT